MELIQKKRKAHKWYRKYRTPENYNEYARVRNQVTWALRKQTKDREKELAKNIKQNPNLNTTNYLSMMKLNWFTPAGVGV